MRSVVPDDADVIAAAIRSLADAGASLVLTTGGTGFAPRDVTPEATRDGHRSRGAGHRRGDPRGRARADAARAALARDRGLRGRDARRQPPGLARRLPRRVRGRPARAAARARARCGRHGDAASADVTSVARSRSRGGSRRSSASSTRCSRCRSPTSARSSPSTRWPGLANMVWITVAMVGARTLAMALNRLVDAEIDARNPRTASRELPSGALTRAQVLGSVRCALGGLPRSRSSSSTRSSAGCGRSRSRCSSSTRT